jgi:hypothetical protein
VGPPTDACPPPAAQPTPFLDFLPDPGYSLTGTGTDPTANHHPTTVATTSTSTARRGAGGSSSGPVVGSVVVPGMDCRVKLYVTVHCAQSGDAQALSLNAGGSYVSYVIQFPGSSVAGSGVVGVDSSRISTSSFAAPPPYSDPSALRELSGNTPTAKWRWVGGGGRALSGPHPGLQGSHSGAECSHHAHADGGGVGGVGGVPKTEVVWAHLRAHEVTFDGWASFVLLCCLFVLCLC